MSHHEFPYPSDFISINGSRMHYVDSGSHEQPVVVMLHGNYSWSYGYRHFMPHLLGAGFRCVVPDHIGFGRSDKPEKVETYTFAFHCANLDAFIKEMGLKNVVIVGWEWGGAMALNYATTHTDNLQALVLMNPGLFLTTRNSLWSRWTNNSFVGDMLARRLNIYMRNAYSKKMVYYKENMDSEVQWYYRNPFPNYASRAGILGFLRMVPTNQNHPSWTSIKTIRGRVSDLRVPTLLISSKGNRSFGISEAKALETLMPNTELRILDDGGYLLQEDRPDLLSRWIIDFLQRAQPEEPTLNPTPPFSV